MFFIMARLRFFFLILIYIAVLKLNDILLVLALNLFEQKILMCALGQQQLGFIKDSYIAQAVVEVAIAQPVTLIVAAR